MQVPVARRTSVQSACTRAGEKGVSACLHHERTRGYPRLDLGGVQLTGRYAMARPQIVIRADSDT